VKIEKTMMSVILLLIVGVAAFKHVSMLVMVVTDSGRYRDTADFRHLAAKSAGHLSDPGLGDRMAGVALGVTLGLGIALHVDTLVPLLEHTFHFQIFDADVYEHAERPVDVRWP